MDYVKRVNIFDSYENLFRDTLDTLNCKEEWIIMFSVRDVEISFKKLGEND